MQIGERLRAELDPDQLDPLNIRRRRDLADYHFISITGDDDADLTTYDVNLCGNEGTEPINLMSFKKARGGRQARERDRPRPQAAGARLCRHRAGRGVIKPGYDLLLPVPEIAMFAAKHRDGRP
ncbi:hypothetical protein [Bradyrhizobium japonicum]|uniref:hypothetical protein n=1 Tax=Bradyrhizobium japonicum TaxID=375 RepID=UPI0020129FFE|nr:hypothetical protein [Bradyrhizobium japonicum]